MYEPFPGNYVWNLSINLCLAMGGVMGEIDPANETIRLIAKAGEDRGTPEFFTTWGKLATQLAQLGRDAEVRGHPLTASEKYLRATAYYITAERLQSRTYEPRRQMYRTMLDTFERAVHTGKLNCERVEIPYDGTSFPGLFIRGHGAGPHPCVVFCNGLDSVKEMIYLCNRDAFATRGISVLALDHPGVGEALRLRGLTAIAETERWASAAVDYLQTRADVAHDRLGILGWSLGGYYAPRAACYEKRFKVCVAWGANHHWGGLQRRRLANEGDRPVPHYWDHVLWVWGQASVEQFLQAVSNVTLDGHLQKLGIPFLIVHGENDRQIPLSDAHQSYAAAVASPDKELKIFTAAEGGVEHVSADNLEPVRSYIADWLAERFQRMS